MKEFFLSLIGINALALVAIAFNYISVKNPSTVLFQASCLNEQNHTESNATTQYKFDDPLIAYHLLQKLDIFEGEDPNPNKKSTARWYLFGTIINDYYCDEHRAYFVNHPEFIFTEKNFMTDDWKGNRFRRITVPSIGKDLHPDLGSSMPAKIRNSWSVHLKPEINYFSTYLNMWKYRSIGKQFSCLTQVSNHCPGHENLVVKDKVGHALVEYAKGYESRPQCFNTDKFFPQTWVMLKPEQCRSFFEVFNSPEYLELKAERNIVYMRKIGAGVHQGKGVFPVNDDEEQYIRTLYDNGNNCDNVTENNVMQTFIHNPLLLQNRKFHFRVFLYIASTNPFIAYYHDGYLRISFQEYDKDSKELGTFVTNLGMTEALYQGEKGDKNPEQLKKDSYSFYPEFQKYLMEFGLVTDPDWLDNYLRAEMKKAMVHIIRMAQSKYLRRSSISELYGVDFMIDENLNLWFIEANPGPLLEGWDGPTVQFFDEMLRDSFEIAFGLLRSRTKRIINYINALTKEKEAWTLRKETLTLQNLKERREEFRQLTMNRFEPEFVPREENGFYQIMDENLEGTERYFDLLEEECL